MDFYTFSVTASGWLATAGVFGAWVNAKRQSEAHRIDPLTGLATRRGFTERATRLLHRPKQQVTCLLMDLNGLKRLNDRDGHAAGDDFIARSAAALQRWLPKNAVLGRLGGDEFVAVWLGSPHRASLANLAEDVDASIGVAVGGFQRLSLTALIHAADVTMYRVKTTTRNGFQISLVAETGPNDAHRWARHGNFDSSVTQ